MQIRSLNATFGRLERRTLELSPGLNIIEAPNEAGKSTLTAFLRVMLYGLPTRERGAAADKNLYAPWSGSAMQGRLELALEGYFSGLADETQKQTLESYLRRRLRPAMELLLREGRTEELEQLLDQDWLTAGLLEDGLSLAISLKSTEGFVLLLRRKAELAGFSDRDFSL